MFVWQWNVLCAFKAPCILYWSTGKDHLVCIWIPVVKLRGWILMYCTHKGLTTFKVQIPKAHHVKIQKPVNNFDMWSTNSGDFKFSGDFVVWEALEALSAAIPQTGFLTLRQFECVKLLQPHFPFNVPLDSGMEKQKFLTVNLKPRHKGTGSLPFAKTSAVFSCPRGQISGGRSQLLHLSYTF